MSGSLEGFGGKVTIVGDGAIGKTCLYSKITNNAVNFEDGDPTYEPTTFNNFKLEWETDDGDEVKLELWDTAGQESFSQLRLLSYPDTDIFLLGYSTTSQISLSNVENKWMEELKGAQPDKQEEGKEPWYVLCGTKVDIRDVNAGGVSRKQASDMAKKLGCVHFLETSAKTGIAIDELKGVIMACLVARGKGELAEVWRDDDDEVDAEVAAPTSEAPAADKAEEPKNNEEKQSEELQVETVKDEKETPKEKPKALKPIGPPKKEKHVENNSFNGDNADGSKPKASIASPRAPGKGGKGENSGGDSGCTCSVM